MKLTKLILAGTLIFMSFQSHAQTTGCLISNTFYTTYIGTVTSSPTDNSFSGSPSVYDLNGNMSDINYQSYEVCNTIRSSTNSITRTGPLCFVMSTAQYNSYPGHVAPSYPGNNGTLETFTITLCPLDGYVWLILALLSGMVIQLFRKREMDNILV